jgi:hypothetical protein
MGLIAVDSPVSNRNLLLLTSYRFISLINVTIPLQLIVTKVRPFYLTQCGAVWCEAAYVWRGVMRYGAVCDTKSVASVVRAISSSQNIRSTFRQNSLL